MTKEILLAGFSDMIEGDWPEPSVFIQWKGTDVCMDFHCKCGAHCHFDGDFAYIVKCPHCETLWRMPDTVYPREAKPEEHWQTEDPKVLEPDEEYMDELGRAVPVE